MGEQGGIRADSAPHNGENIVIKQSKPTPGCLWRASPGCEEVNVGRRQEGTTGCAGPLGKRAMVDRPGASWLLGGWS